MRFLQDNNINLSIDPRIESIQPQILLGCSDLFDLLEDERAKNKRLPSGLRLIFSKLGYLIAGCNRKRKTMSENNIILATEITPIPQETAKHQSWDEFCTFESSGVQEFSGSNAEERRQQNAAVWEQFEKTIQKREDGYYVRLPWKENANTLPPNKSMAIQRLQSTINKLTTNPVLFQEYHETIIQQLNRGIIEEVKETNSLTKKNNEIIHYLPHQAVITPNKETTKLRIVYDASAHPKNAPSLNDVLHQGPVFLPQICDILLRFRTGNVAIISDVEKAFLQ
ncbi:hypothetical protein DICVIV_13232, partial [Dictyocaulus viviparus]